MLPVGRSRSVCGVQVSQRSACDDREIKDLVGLILVRECARFALTASCFRSLPYLKASGQVHYSAYSCRSEGYELLHSTLPVAVPKPNILSATIHSTDAAVHGVWWSSQAEVTCP
jgi:hypothetical protein